jgi:hypothetical protein
MPDFPHYFRAVWMSPSANACTLRDSADADGATLDKQAARGHEMRTKVPPVRNANGYSKDRSRIDVAADTVTCPAHQTVSIRAGLRTASRASVRSAVVSAAGGLHQSPSGAGDQYSPALQHGKARQCDVCWQQDYRTYRPVVERKISHFTRRHGGGRKARYRGHKQDFTKQRKACHGFRTPSLPGAPPYQHALLDGADGAPLVE